MEKSKIICDTDVMIDFLNPEKKRHQVVRYILETDIELKYVTISAVYVTISAVTKMELMVGASNKVSLNKLNKSITRFNTLLINPEITSIAIGLLEIFKLSHNLAIPDALIAATALHADLKLLPLT